jgi:ferredoxin
MVASGWSGVMTDKGVRKIVHIDPDKCDGCGVCVPSCAEGAVQIIDGKAQLVGDNLCDGLGNCLGACPQDAITIEERPADAFDEAAVEAHLKAEAVAQPTEAAETTDQPRVCPGMRMRQLGERKDAPAAAPTGGNAAQTSQLTHWPVQLTLLPEQGPIWGDADVLLAADCVAYALPDFPPTLFAR